MLSSSSSQQGVRSPQRKMFLIESRLFLQTSFSGLAWWSQDTLRASAPPDRAPTPLSWGPRPLRTTGSHRPAHGPEPPAVSMETHQPQRGVTPPRRIGAFAYQVKVSSARGANGASDGRVLAERRGYGGGPRGLYRLYQSRAEMAVMDRRSGKRPQVRAFTQQTGRKAEKGPMRSGRGWDEKAGCSGSGGRG